MDEKKIIGHSVKHKKLGSGKITGFKDGDVRIEFGKDDIRDFGFPSAFVDYLVIDDEDLQKEILAQNEVEENEKKKQKTAVKETKDQYRKDILSWGESYLTHADALNDCFGFDYKHYQKAYKVLSDPHYAVWFPNIARQIEGEYVSTDRTLGWVNILTEAGKTLIQMDNGKVQEFDRENSEDRFVFAKFDGETGYRFIGLFDRGERVEGGIKFKLISRKFDLIKMKPLDV